MIKTPAPHKDASSLSPPVLDTLFIYDCVDSHKDKAVLQSADDAAVVGLIGGVDETEQRREVASMVILCDIVNSLSLNSD